MTLEQLQKEMIQAMKNGEKDRKQVLSSLVGAVKKAAIDRNCRDNITEELVDSVLLKEQKTAQEMIDTCPADRVSTLTTYKANLEVIKEFAPKLLESKEDIYSAVMVILAKNSIEVAPENKAFAIKIIMPQLKGKAKMDVVNSVISEIFKK